MFYYYCFIKNSYLAAIPEVFYCYSDYGYYIYYYCYCYWYYYCYYIIIDLISS